MQIYDDQKIWEQTAEMGRKPKKDKATIFSIADQMIVTNSSCKFTISNKQLVIQDRNPGI
jgi:hypothetical protein